MMALDAQSFLALVLNKRTALLAFIRAIVRDDHLAEDVFQESVSLAFHSLDKIRDADHWLAWMRLTARHRAINALRQRKRYVFGSPVLDLLQEEWDEEPGTDQTALRDCVGRLSPNARHLLGLRYSEGLSGERLAEAVNRNLNTVYVALTRIHRTLRDCLEKRRTAERLAHE